GNAVAQRLDFYNLPQLLYRPQTPQNAWIEIPFSVQKKEPLRLLINATTSYDFGKYQAYLNGIKIGDVMDFYSDSIQNREFHLLDFWPDPGKYTLKLECVGKNSRSEGYYLGIESIRLRERRPRVYDYGHNKVRDWQKNPILYR
ncbi:MAG: hypothetical protein ACPMAG_11515, partial [Limisphaerales bacterium]